MNWKVSIPDWTNPISSIFACSLKNYGKNKSPSLSWDPVPEAKSYAFILQDIHPISHSFIHWYIPSISNEILQIDSLSFQNMNANSNHLFTFYQQHPEIKVRQGINSHDTVGYFGPCPPEGSGKHTYVFRIMALDQDLYKMEIEDLYKERTFEEWDSFLQKLNVKIICENRISGTFEK